MRSLFGSLLYVVKEEIFVTYNLMNWPRTPIITSLGFGWLGFAFFTACDWVEQVRQLHAALAQLFFQHTTFLVIDLLRIRWIGVWYFVSSIFQVVVDNMIGKKI